MAHEPLFLIYKCINPSSFLFLTIFTSFLIKIYFLTILTSHGLRSKAIYYPLLFLIGTLFGSLFGDIAWILKLSQKFIIFHYGQPLFSLATITFFMRIAWAFWIIQYQSLSLFIQSLAQKKFTIHITQKILVTIHSIFAFYFFYLSFFGTSTLTKTEHSLSKKMLLPPLEMKAMYYLPFYLICALIIPCILLCLWHMHTKQIPKILKTQIKIFILFFVCPYLIVELSQSLFIIFEGVKSYFYHTAAFSTLLLTYGTYYCLKKIMGLRFLNFSQHIRSKKPSVNFINSFKKTLGQLGQATHLQELRSISQAFFKDSFNIPLNATLMYIHKKDRSEQLFTHADYKSVQASNIFEQLISQKKPEIIAMLNQTKICILDDIAFNNFYEETHYNSIALKFITAINADIFLPIFEQQNIIAYIIVKHNTRKNECYSTSERDQMIVFANYLASAINLITNRSINLLIQQEKKLKEDVHRKKQELNLFSETIKSFLHHEPYNPIGIFIYKKNQFLRCNQETEELVSIDINNQEGHPVSKAFKALVSRITTDKAPHKIIIHNNHGKRIVLSGAFDINKENILITASYPTISDIASIHTHQLNHAADWNYFLHLETTNAGKRIDSIIPASSPFFLNKKIDLFKTSLHKNVTLLNVPDDDLKEIVSFLHNVSLNETFHVIELNTQETNLTIFAQLFGSDSLLHGKKKISPLLENINNTITLFIKNVHLLDIKTQKQLANFIRYGFVNTVQENQIALPKTPRIRIICSINQSIDRLLQTDSIAIALYQEFKHNILTIPPLATLPNSELNALAHGFEKQVIQAHTCYNLLSLTSKDIQKIIDRYPESFYEFKLKVTYALLKKSKNNNIDQEDLPTHLYEANNPQLVRIANKGIHALKDQSDMKLLWDTFKNIHKIADFLGVHRSSVYKRCKAYNLH